MYLHDEPYLPKEINRNKFVDIIFDLGYYNQHRYDTIIAAVQIGDYFVSYKGKRTPYIPISSKIDISKYDFMKELVPQIYSEELAHVVTTISSSINEIIEYNINRVVVDTVNYYVYKMQWEICMVIGFSFKINNFMTVIHELITICNKNNIDLRMSSVFWDISKAICMNIKYLQTNPKVILLAIVLLYNNNKLKAIKEHRKRIFQSLVIRIVNEYELSLSEFLNIYIKLKE